MQAAISNGGATGCAGAGGGEKKEGQKVPSLQEWESEQHGGGSLGASRAAERGAWSGDQPEEEELSATQKRRKRRKEKEAQQAALAQ